MPASEDLPGLGQGSPSYDEEPERSAELRHVRAGDSEIVVARYAGYCYGVERALRLTGEALEGAPAPVATLGPIIHNPSVVGSLKDRGVDVVDDVDDAAAGTLIVRTHGVSPDVIEHAHARRLNVVDATCPFVSVAQRKAAALREAGYAVVILGERDHPEVVGLQGFAGADAVVVEDAAGLPLERLRGRRVGVVVQTTQTRANLSALAAELAPLARELLVLQHRLRRHREAPERGLRARRRGGRRRGGRRAQQRQHRPPRPALRRHRAADPPHRVRGRAAARVAGGRASRRRDRGGLDPRRGDRGHRARAAGPLR